MKFTEQEIKDYEAQNNVVITRCPVCEPLSYYGGKTGYKEVEDKNMCDCCWKELDDSSDKQKSSEEDPIRAVFGNARNTREL